VWLGNADSGAGLKKAVGDRTTMTFFKRNNELYFLINCISSSDLPLQLNILRSHHLVSIYCCNQFSFPCISNHLISDVKGTTIVRLKLLFLAAEMGLKVKTVNQIRLNTP